MHIRESKGREGVFWFLPAAWASAALLVPRISYAAEVGCFCTFVFVSIMFVIGVGIAVFFKYLLSRALWRLSWKRITASTVLEVFLLAAVFFIVQAQFFLSVLVYFPFAIALNMMLLKGGDQAVKEAGAPMKRLAMSVLCSSALPVAVQAAGALSKIVSGMISFTEVHV